jgi:hypothetical protein
LILKLLAIGGIFHDLAHALEPFVAATVAAAAQVHRTAGPPVCQSQFQLTLSHNSAFADKM